MTGITLGLRTWPEWAGWGFCPRTGGLVDPHGNTYRPNELPGAMLVWRAFEVRDRVWTPDGQSALADRVFRQ